MNLKPRGERKLSSQQIEAALSPALQAIPGARISCARAGGGGGQTAITLVGDDPAELQTTASAVERQMRALPGLTDVASTAALLRPELVITPKPDIAAELGVSAQDLSQVARIATLGDADQLLPKYNLGDRQIPIRIMLTEPARQDLGVIRSLRVPTRFGSSVPLSAVADISFGAGPNQIDRYDRRRSATIQATLNGLTFGDAQKAIEALPAMRNLPASVLERPAGDAEAFGEIFGGFFFAIATGIVLMYLVLVLLFRSFSTPVTILVALPLSFGGAFILQLLTRTTLSLPTLIGLIMLTGVAAKNSILLVEYAIEAIRSGMTRTAALMDAAHKRARPIIMTTIAMGAGMTPIALKWGAGGEFRQPMAVAVIGGLITSTLLSLVFIPVAFTFIDDIRRAFRRAFAGPLTPEGKDEDDARVLPAE